MKVLHLIYTKGIAGAEKHLMDLLPGLKPYGIECELMLVSPGAFNDQLMYYCRKMESLGIKTTIMSAGRPGFFLAAWKISRYLKKNDIHILHSHLFNSDLLSALIKQFFYWKVYIVSTKHGYSEMLLKQYTGKPEEVHHDLYYRMTEYTLHRIDQNLSVSKGISDLYMNLGFTRESYPVIPHGIHIDSLPEKNADSPYRLSAHQLIIVGRLEEFKGHYFLLNALRDVIQRFPDLVLLILGEGSQKELLQQQVKDLHLETHVIFMGFRDDPYLYMTNSDIIVLPSLFEPFGLVFIESFALRVPVIAFDTPAGNEIINNGENGILVPRNDSGKLSEKIIYLLEDPEAGAKLVVKAFNRYRDYYNAERMCKDTAIFYQQLPV